MTRMAGDTFVVAATHIGVIVMIRGIPEPKLTAQVSRNRQLAVDDLARLTSFRPLLMLKYPAGQPSKDYYVVMKSEIIRGGISVWAHFQPQRGKGNLKAFSPNLGLMDLRGLRRQNLLGNWKLKCSVLILSKNSFDSIPTTEVVARLSQRQFHEMATLEWSIVETVTATLTADGRLQNRMTYDEVNRLQERRVSIDDL